ncbi:hypothetical protein, partial [Ferroplasma sp. Type II]|uniref:hypothetical protein n=1 Tax=Ferroplasma sp. Type II TaxID=261388 RepID=UPI0025B9CE6D
ESYANETKCYDENGFKASMDNSIGLGAYISQGFNTEKHRECIGVTMFGGASGYGGNMESEVCDRHHPIEITRYTLAPYYTSLSLEGINSPESNVMYYEPNNSTGINTTTTHSSSKPGFNMLKYKQDILEGIIDNTVNFMGIQTSLSSIGKYYSDASLDSYSICKSGNGPVYIHFHVNPSSGKSMGSNKCRYTYGTIVTYDISIRNYNNSESFKLGFNNVYGCTKSSYGGGSTSTTNAAHTSLCANAVPSSAIYGPILYQSNGSTDHINNKFLYIKDMTQWRFL